MTKPLLNTKISPLFIGLITISFAIFAFAMINLSSLPTPEQKKAEFQQQMDDLILAEEAQVTGKTIEELKGQKKKALTQREVIHNINQAVLKKNNQQLKDLLSILKTPPNASTALVSAIYAKNVDAFNLLLAANFPCNTDTDPGSRVFSASISTEDSQYLKILLQKGCQYLELNKQKSLGQRIINSSSPVKIFQIPELNLAEEYGNKALQKAIQKRREKQALIMIELGANIDSKNLLRDTVRLRAPSVALALIKKGIHYEAKTSDGFILLSEIIKLGFIDVAKALLEQDPDHIKKHKLESAVYNAVSNIRLKQARREALTLILEYGVDPSKLKDTGIHGLVMAIFRQDDVIVEQLLQNGVNPNIPDHLNLALVVAKSIDSPRYKHIREVYRSRQGDQAGTQQKIISLLEQQGATDDFLKAMMQKKGIKTIKECRIKNMPKVRITSPEHSTLSGTIPRNSYQQCSKVASQCTDQGFGMDDCMRSIPRCQSDEKSVFCCNKKIQKQYFIARCSGLLVNETLQWLKLEFGR